MLVNMAGIVVRFEQDPLSMLEHGMAALRQLSEQGDEASRIPQTRALIAGLLTTGAFLDVAEALATRILEITGEPRDRDVLAIVRSKNVRR